jgi:hypothetical protein
MQICPKPEAAEQYHGTIALAYGVTRAPASAKWFNLRLIAQEASAARWEPERLAAGYRRMLEKAVAHGFDLSDGVARWRRIQMS